MAKTVLVTGAAGYIGRHVVRELAERGAQVIALDRSRGDIDAGVKYVQAELDDVDAGFFAQHGVPDVCLHLAWRDGFNHNAHSHIENLSAHFRFLTAVSRAGVGQLTILGTMHEVGYWEGEIDEATPTNPRSLYGVAKNTLRQALELELAKSDVVLQWIRAFYILGDYERGQSIFSKIWAWEKEGRETFPFTLGLNKYDFITVELLAKQISATALQNEINGIINCCSGTPVALKDKVDQFLSEFGMRILPEYGAFPDRAYDSPVTWGNVEKINSILRLEN